jgi:NADPH:quinone reductase
MKAAWYEQQGPARDVLILGEMPDPHPGAREVRLRVAASGLNPGDIKKRQDTFGYGMAYARVIPHSDGAGQVDEVGAGVSSEWLGQSVWCYGAQSYRPFGTAAEFTVVPVEQVMRLPPGVPMEQGACLGIPGITAHRGACRGRRSGANHFGARRGGFGRPLRRAAGSPGRSPRHRDDSLFFGRRHREESGSSRSGS